MSKSKASAAAKASAPAEGAAEQAVTRTDVTHTAFDNEHEDGVHCTLTFADGETATGTAPNTGDLAADQAAAKANALAAA